MKRAYKKSKPSTIHKTAISKSRNCPPDALYLVIVESPSKCAKIEAYLGPQYHCIASRGHIRDLGGLKGVDVKNNFTLTFQILEDKREWVESMRHIIQQFPKNRIILATDNDREGEAIAYHICEVFDLPIATTPRILFSEITKAALTEAVAHPTTINMPLVNAQKARQVLDIIIGFKISPLLWKYIYHSKSSALSAGRVQTPVLRLVYDNMLEKEAADKRGGEPKYKTTATFLEEGVRFDLSKEHDSQESVVSFLEKSIVFSHRLTLGEKTLSNRAPPKPLNTSRLLQAAHNQLHYSPKQTMQYAQELYQAGYITYMRTENTKYARDFLKSVEGHLLADFGDDRYLGKIDILENTDTNNPHEAIRPTSIGVRTLESGNKSAALYRLIWKTTLESCMSDAVYHTYRVSISAPDDLSYTHILEIPLFLGWKASSTPKTDAAAHLAKMGGLLFHIQTLVKSAAPIPPKCIESVVTVHSNHRHYTESSIIQKMEELGIGRPSTYALMVDTVQDRGYVKCQDVAGKTIQCIDYTVRNGILEKATTTRTFGNERQRLVITPMGKICIAFLIQHFDALFSYDYTEKMEKDLDKIAETQDTVIQWYEYCGKYWGDVVQQIAPISKIHRETYPLDESHILQFQSFGPAIKRTLIGGGVEYLPVKKTVDLDIERLKSGGYTLADLAEFETPLLGKYQDLDVFVRMGEFGPYIEWGDKKKSIRDIEIPLNQLCLDDVLEILETKDVNAMDDAPFCDVHPINANTNILRVVDEHRSIRGGKFGPYIYYKTDSMKSPTFITLKRFPGDFRTCEKDAIYEWINRTEDKPKTRGKKTA